MIATPIMYLLLFCWSSLANGAPVEESNKIRRSSIFFPFVETSLQNSHPYHSVLQTARFNQPPFKRTMLGIPKIHTVIEVPVKPPQEKETVFPGVSSTTDIATFQDSSTVNASDENGEILAGSTEMNITISVESTSVTPNSSEPNLELIEQKLRKSKDKDSSSLLLAISLLHNHQQKSEDNETSTVSINSKPDDTYQQNSRVPVLEKLHQKSKPTFKAPENREFKEGKIPSKKRYHFVESAVINNEVESSATSYQDVKEIPKASQPHQFHWFVLLLDGKCCEIRHRMNTFVRYLKATLAAKLEAKYDDIYVPSVLCDSSFMVNVSFDLSLYPKGYQKLHRMAEVNTTLLEISGQIFYLEKVLSSQPSSRFRLQDYFDRNYDMKVVLYVTLGCMTAFILISVVTIALIKVCYQRYNVPEDSSKTMNTEEKLPQVIYSPDFSHSLKINEEMQHSFATSPTLEDGIAPHESTPQSSFGSRINAFKCQLIGNKVDQDSSHLSLLQEVDHDTDFLDPDTDNSDC